MVFRNREAEGRPPLFVAVYLMSLLFFLPVFAFVDPFPAVAGLTLAHGYQYILLLVLISGAERTGRLAVFALPIVIELALLGGILLTAADLRFQDGAGTGRALYGAYLGVVMAHFVVDAGLWRLRDEFPRKFLGERIPYLLRPPEGSRPVRAESGTPVESPAPAQPLGSDVPVSPPGVPVSPPGVPVRQSRSGDWSGTPGAERV
jgi:hypothetical protein